MVSTIVIKTLSDIVDLHPNPTFVRALNELYRLEEVLEPIIDKKLPLGFTIKGERSCVVTDHGVVENEYVTAFTIMPVCGFNKLSAIIEKLIEMASLPDLSNC